MNYHPVVDRFAMPIALDAWSAAIFAAAFVAAALLTARRASFGLCALILVMPFAFPREVAGTTVTLSKAVLLGVLVGLTAYPTLLRKLRELPAPLLLGGVALYLAATALSAFDASHLAPTLREFFKVLEYAALFVGAYLAYRIDPADGAIVAAAAAVTIAVSLSALAQELLGAPSGLYVGTAIVPRIAGVLEGPNQLAGYDQIAIAVVGAWTIARRTVWLEIALALAVCADVLTFSRAGLFGLLVVAAVLAIARGRAALPAARAAGVGLAAGLAVVGCWAWVAHSANILRASLQESAYAGGVGDRAELWRAAWRMFLRHPLLGVGAGNYELVLPQYGVFGVRTHANSWFLQSLAEGGIALFAATLALLAAIFVALGRALRLRSPWILAAFAASVALTIHQIADYLVFYPKVGGAWWILLGIAAAAAARGA